MMLKKTTWEADYNEELSEQSARSILLTDRPAPTSPFNGPWVNRKNPDLRPWGVQIIFSPPSLDDLSE